MTDIDHTLTEMESVLKELILNAERMKQLSAQSVSEADIMPLQDKQEELLEQLEKLDKQFQKDAEGKKHPKRKLILEMLTYFEKLNGEFIENIRKTSGLIEFEERKGKKEE